MKRLVLALAAAVLGSACGSSTPPPCNPTATVDWSFRNANGGVTADCTTAGVAWVDVFDNGVLVGSFDCNGPAGAVPLTKGANQLIVEGGSGNAILFRDVRNVNAANCGDQGLIAAQPTQGYLAVDYSFSPTNTCDPTPPTYMFLEVNDDLAGQIAFQDTGTGAGELCSVTAAAPRYAVAIGQYTFIGINEWSPANGTVAGDCTPRPFEIDPQLVTTVYPQLVYPASKCFAY